MTPAHLVRALVSLPSGVSTFATPPTTGALVNGARERVYLGTVPIPPTARLDGESAEAALVQIQTKWQDVSAAALRVDALVGWPHDEPQLEAYIYGGVLTDNRDWLLDTRRDGTVTGRLYESGTTTDAGQPATNNVPLMLGPGAAHLIVALTGTNGIADTADLAAVVSVELTPRYRLIPGAP